MSDANGATDRQFTRVEAAEFLTSIGREITAQRLAVRAVEGLGPRFEKSGRNVVYRESDLRLWAAEPEKPKKKKHKGGRGNRAPKLLAVPPDVARRLNVRDLATVVRQHVELADQFFESDSPNMQVAVQFIRSLELLRRMV